MPTMKTLFLSVFMLLPFGSIIAGIPETGDPDVIIRQMLEEIRIIVQISASEIGNAEADLEKTSRELTTSTDSRRQLELLVEKDRLSEKLRALRIDTENEISKVRYLKGLQIIKILYEKVLSLDHHFASVRTLNEINKISNPTQYQEYNRLREIIAGKRDKKTGFDLTGILGTNTIVSLVQTFTNMLGSGMSREEKEKEITNVECILDFTLRMQNDLNTIYFETAFLQKSNDKVKQEIELLFKDYTKPIGYVATLESCRSNDDWETINQKMEEYLAKMKAATGTSQYKMQVNLEFPIDRLLQFITQYNNFIDQGGKFYEKFKIILNSYENEKQCETRLPAEYKKLKADIDLAIEKFNVAYKPVEVNGSKMKEILYGLNEFD
jgi:hypothetical protein